MDLDVKPFNEAFIDNARSDDSLEHLIDLGIEQLKKAQETIDNKSKPKAKKTKTPKAKRDKSAKVALVKSNPLPELSLVPVEDRIVPYPDKHHAQTLFKIIQEHIYWLGDAVTQGDQERTQREINDIVRYAKMYRTFAGEPEHTSTKKRKPIPPLI